MAAFKTTAIRLAALGLSVATLSACATSQPAYPVRIDQQPAPAPAPPPPPPPPPPRPRDPEIPNPAPSTPVQAQPLAPIGKGPASAPPPAVAPRAPAVAAAAQPSPWVQPPPATETPRQVTVERGETLFEVAERVRTPVRAIIEMNALQPPYELAAGTVLKVPPPVIYNVRTGDTLFGIARRFNIDPRSLANLNSIALETSLRPGQAIALPSLARDQGSNQQASGPSPNGMALAVARPPTPQRPTASGTTAPPPVTAGATASISDSEVARAGRGRFLWPVRGQVLSTFGPKGPGQRNDGLNIAGNVGQKVAAAAGGEVVFSGDLPGFGNLVLLKHDGGWVTAYAHLSKVSVKMRDRLTQGQEVGQVGQTGLVDRPQLHFEVRYAATPKEKARPVDPSLLLPSA